MDPKRSLVNREVCINLGVRVPLSAYCQVLELAKRQGEKTMGPTLRGLVMAGLAQAQAGQKIEVQHDPT